MKKVAIVILILGVLAGLAFILLPKEFKLTIPVEELQKKSGEKFPKIVGKIIKLSPPKSKFPKPPFPKPPGLDKPDLPKPPEYILMLNTMKSAKMTLKEEKIYLDFDMLIRVTGKHLFGFKNTFDLPYHLEYKPVDKELRSKFSEHPLTNAAKIKMVGKDTCLIEDNEAEYVVVRDKEMTQVFASRSDGEEIPSISSKGKAKISGELKFKKETNTIFFEDFKVHKLKLDTLPDAHLMPIELIQKKITVQVTKMLQRESIPICDLNETAKEKEPKMVQVLGKLLLKEVKVGDNHLILVLSLKK